MRDPRTPAAGVDEVVVQESAYPVGITERHHIAHDMRHGRFPQRSSIATFLHERANPLISADLIAVVLEEYARVEDGRLENIGYLAVKLAEELEDRLRSLLPPAPQPSSPGGAGEVVGWQEVTKAPRRRKLIVGWWNARGKWRTTMACYYPANTLQADDDSGDEFAAEGWYEETQAHEILLPLEYPPSLFRYLPDAPLPALSPQPDAGEAT